VPSTVQPVKRKQYCQTPRKGWEEIGEEEIIESLLSQLGLLRAGEVAVDIGAWDGEYLSNTKALEEYHGFKRFLFDGDSRGNPNVIQEWITPENVNEIMQRHGVPTEPALLSLDIDGFDFHLRQAMTMRPAVIVMEFNGTLDPLIPVTVPYRPDWRWKDGEGNYFGASWSAIRKVNEAKGYTYVRQCACLNAFFVRNDLVKQEMVGNLAPPRIAKYHRHVPGEWESV
jgi:hypothetical protein